MISEKHKKMSEWTAPVSLIDEVKKISEWTAPVSLIDEVKNLKKFLDVNMKVAF